MNEFKGKLDFDGVKSHILAGNSVLTFHNIKTNNHLTYKIKKDKKKDIWYVYYLSGPHNESNYSYLGLIGKNNIKNQFNFILTKASKASKKSIVYKSFNWIYDRLNKNKKFPDFLEVWHEGICGKCGRKLTHPESIETGFGPTCIKKIKGWLWKKYYLYMELWNKDLKIII